MIRLPDTSRTSTWRSSRESSPPPERRCGRLYISPQAEALLGYSQADFRADPDLWRKRLHPDDQARVLAEVARCHRTGGQLLTEYRMITKDGRVVWFRDQARVLRADENGPPRLHGIMIEITDAKLAEQKLRESEDRYRQLFRAVSDAIVVFDVDTREVVDVNESALRLYGYTREELSGVRQWDMTGEPVASERAVQEILAGRRDKVQVRYHRKKDGTLFPVSISASVFEAGGRRLLCAVVRDVTEHMRARGELERSRRFIESVANTTPNLLYVYDIPAGRNVYVNDRISQMLGYSKEKVQAMGSRLVETLVHPDDVEQAAAHLCRMAAARDNEVYENQYRMRSANGEWRWLLSRDVVFARDEEGRVAQILGTAEDVTERKRAEQALRESEQRYRLLAENVTDVIWSFDLSMRRTYVSPSVQRLRGYTVEEAMRQRLEDVLTPASLDVARKAIAEELAAARQHPGGPPRVRVLELEMRCKDGRTVWTECSARLLQDEAGRPVGILGVTRDITQRRRLEKALVEVHRRAEQAVGEDLHDSLGQKLTGIAYLAKVLQKELSARSLDEADDAASILELANYAVMQTRALARGLMPVELETHGLMSSLQELVAEKEELFGIPCSFRCERPVLVQDVSVATHLYRIAREAVSNAIRHASPKHVSVALAEHDETVVLTVRDDGVGMEEAAAEAKGMGLKIMRYRAQMIGASLQIRSRPGGSTTVVCRVPKTAGAEPGE